MAELNYKISANVLQPTRLMFKVLYAHLWLLGKMGVEDIDIGFKTNSIWFKRTLYIFMTYKIKKK